MPIENKVSRRRFLSIAAGTTSASLLYPESGFSAMLDEVGRSPDAVRPTGNWRDEGVIDLSKSPYAKLNTIPIRAVTIQEGFWSRRRATNENVSIPFLYSEFVEHGIVNNFLRLQGKSNAPRSGPRYTDSDIYKWVEAASFCLSSGHNRKLHQILDGTIQAIVGAQQPDGYLNTYWVGKRASQRLLPETQIHLGDTLYCIGHLIQAAIACYRATGEEKLLDAGIRFLDDFLLPGYGPVPDKKPLIAGHPEISMAAIELYRTTGDRNYLDLAGYILHGDSRIHMTKQQSTILFCGIPFTSRTDFAGAHAVRATYACCGATDYYMETGDPAYLRALDALWTDLHERQMYITAGVGARRDGECFGQDYELPNEQAYCETCAAIGNMMWNFRMLFATGDARYADIMERAFYNGINSGLSLDGKKFNYRNPLAFDQAGLPGGRRYTPYDKVRQAWYTTTCCPPNVERTLASLPGYFYGTSKDGLYVHLYDNSELNWRLQSGTAIHVEQRTRYPWDGDISIKVTSAEPEVFTLHVRIPGWSKRSEVRVNGVAAEHIVAGRYLPIRRKWKAGDLVEISLDMQTQILTANRAVAADVGRVAFQRGPLVYCMEQLDQSDTVPRDFPGFSALLDGKTDYSYEAHVLDGAGVLTHPGVIGPLPSREMLYNATLPEKGPTKDTHLRLIPYYAWGNRDATPMQVWIPYWRS